MKRKVLFLFLIIILILALSGCGGVFNLNGWVWPEDLDFITMIEGLKTPQEISDYMIDNFYYESHGLWTPSPYTLWKTGKGDCNDFATFGIFAAHWHGYETYLIKMIYSGSVWDHWLGVYVEDDGLSYTDNESYRIYDYLNDIYGFNSFKGIVDFACIHHPEWKLKDYIVYDYENKIIETGSSGDDWIIPFKN